MRKRSKTVTCPQCHKRLSPQGLNGHLRFVHGAGSVEASKAVARAPRTDAPESVTPKLEARIDTLEEQFEGLVEALADNAQEKNTPSGMRRRLVALVAELADAKNQRSGKEWDVLWSGSDESKQIVASLDQVESDIRSEIAELTAKLREPEA